MGNPHAGVEVQPRWPWFVASGFLFTSGALTAVSVHLHWIPCRGGMLDGTVFNLTTIPNLTRLAMVLAIASWIVLVLGLRLGRETKWVALLAAVVPLIVAVQGISAALNRRRDPKAYISGWLWIAVEIVALVIFIVLSRLNAQLPSRILVGLGVVLWGATAFGLAHSFFEYMTMAALNRNNWDTPPGTGWITVVVLVTAGSAALWFGASRHESPPLVSTLSNPMCDSGDRESLCRQDDLQVNCVPGTARLRHEVDLAGEYAARLTYATVVPISR